MKQPSNAGSWKLGRRATLGITDQVLSSLTNFALNILVVRSVTTDAYGTFALTFALYIVFRSGIHALVVQPLLVRHTEHLAASRAQSPRTHQTYELALGGGLELGFVGGGMLVIGAVCVSGDLRSSFLVLALILPGLMMQEVMRAVYFAQGRPGGAIALDGGWGVAQLVLVGALFATGHSQVSWLLFVWGVSAALCTAVAMGFERLRARIRGAARWLLDLREISFPFFGEIMVLQITTQGIAFVLAALAGLEAVGVFRSAQVLFSPLNVLLLAAPIVGIPEAVRLLKRRPDRFVMLMVGAGAAATVGVSLWCVVVLAIPTSIGQRLLGESWSQASQILLESAIYYVGTAAGLGALIGLRALALARVSFVARSISGVAGLALGSIGAAVSGASGAALGFGAGAVIGAVLVWIGFVPRAGATTGDREVPLGDVVDPSPPPSAP